MNKPKRVTAKMAAEWKQLVGRMKTQEIADRYGVNPGTVIYHTNKKVADHRRRYWCEIKRRKRDAAQMTGDAAQ